MSDSLGPQFSPDLVERANAHSRQSTGHDERPIHDPFWTDHDRHGPNPVFKEGPGWHDAACGYFGCKHFDEAGFDKIPVGRDKHGEVTRINPRTAPLRASESKVDLHTVRQYAAADPGKGPARVVEHQGGLHIVDGHHRLLGAWLAGRDADVEVFR